MRILTYDLARTVGWAFAEGEGEPEHGTFSLPRTEGVYGPYLRRFAEILCSHVAAFKPTLIVYECPIMPATSKIDILRALYCMGPRLEEVADIYGIECREGELGPIRKHFLGAGKVPQRSADIKDAIMAECHRRGWRPCDHNAGDALALLDFVRANRIPGWSSRGRPLLEKATT